MKVLAKNKRAFHDYTISDKIEAGVVLTGDEVKSVKAGSISLADSFVTPKDGELYLINCYIAKYKNSFRKSFPKDFERRSRKLLLHRREIGRLIGAVSRKGVTLLPLMVYLNSRGIVKVEVGLAKHKQLVNKKKELRERDIKRQVERETKVRIN
jgi:SsrA-binding protein